MWSELISFFELSNWCRYSTITREKDKKRIIHLIYFVHLLLVDSKTFCNASSSHEQKAKIVFRKRIARIDVKNWKWTTFDIMNVSWGLSISLNEARGKKRKSTDDSDHKNRKQTMKTRHHIYLNNRTKKNYDKEVWIIFFP